MPIKVCVWITFYRVNDQLMFRRKAVVAPLAKESYYLVQKVTGECHHSMHGLLFSSTALTLYRVLASYGWLTTPYGVHTLARATLAHAVVFLKHCELLLYKLSSINDVRLSCLHLVLSYSMTGCSHLPRLDQKMQDLQQVFVGLHFGQGYDATSLASTSDLSFWKKFSLLTRLKTGSN